MDANTSAIVVVVGVERSLELRRDDNDVERDRKDAKGLSKKETCPNLFNFGNIIFSIF